MWTDCIRMHLLGTEAGVVGRLRAKEEQAATNPQLSPCCALLGAVGCIQESLVLCPELEGVGTPQFPYSHIWSAAMAELAAGQ